MKKSLILLLLACAPAAHALEPYQPPEIGIYRNPGAIHPDRAETVKPYQAETIKPYQAETIKPYQAETVKPYQAETVKPNSQTMGQKEVKSHASLTTPPKKSLRQAAKAVVGLWQTNIPGAVYTTPSGLSGYDILHVSSGTTAGLLQINSNGTYSWNSYGGKKGRWVPSKDPEYPITIIDTVENRRWRVGFDTSKGTLYIWDGSIWYEGRKAKVGR